MRKRSCMDASPSDRPASDQAPPGAPRRTFLSAAGTAAMAGGLAAGYGTFAAVAGRFLFPAREARRGWLFVARADSLKPGSSLNYLLPSGKPVAITRRGSSGSAADFLALSSTCPHLGCQVHWEPQNDRFFCPCHNGTFDPSGKATGGPPGDAGQSLPQYPLKVENGLLFVEVTLEGV